jgi:hypothetical protein
LPGAISLGNALERPDRKLLVEGSGERLMSKLDLPDMCAHLDRLQRLCNKLEKAQSDEQRYREIAFQIRAETDALHAIICRPFPSLASTDGVRI